MVSKFLAVKCAKCKNGQVVFERPATDVKCLVCGESLVAPTGGRGEVKGRLVGPVE